MTAAKQLGHVSVQVRHAGAHVSGQVAQLQHKQDRLAGGFADAQELAVAKATIAAQHQTIAVLLGHKDVAEQLKGTQLLLQLQRPVLQLQQAPAAAAPAHSPKRQRDACKPAAAAHQSALGGKGCGCDPASPLPPASGRLVLGDKENRG